MRLPIVNFGITVGQRQNPSISRFQLAALTLMQQFRVCLPGIVQTFYPDTQQVDVLVPTNENVWFNSPVNDNALSLQTQAAQLPLLEKIPIFIANGGGLNLTFPIEAGDECMVIFADTPLSVWYQSGGLNNNPIDQRRHSLSDGIAIFGVRSQPNVLPDYSTDSAQLRTDDGETVIDIKDGQISVTANTVTITAASHVTIGSATTIDGKVFLAHSHSGVQTGGSDTGPVV